MVLAPITTARVTVICLAASIGWSSFSTKVQTPLEQPVSRAANDTGFGTPHSDETLAMKKMKTVSASLVDIVVTEDHSHSNNVNLPLARVDFIFAMGTLQNHLARFVSVADGSFQERPESETIQHPPITEQSDAPKPWKELPFIQVVALFWGAFSHNGFPMARKIVASLPLDCMLMFFFFGWRRRSCSGKKADQSTECAGLDERNLNGNEEPEASHDVVEASLATDVDQADVPPMASLQQNDTLTEAEQKPSSTECAGLGWRNLNGNEEPEALHDVAADLDDALQGCSWQISSRMMRSLQLSRNQQGQSR